MIGKFTEANGDVRYRDFVTWMKNYNYEEDRDFGSNETIPQRGFSEPPMMPSPLDEDFFIFDVQKIPPNVRDQVEASAQKISRKIRERNPTNEEFRSLVE